jgi:hypothetical protein
VSLLIVGLPVEVTDQLIPLLVGQGDEVRIVEGEAGRIERWRSLGAHVARGAPEDDDLVERAAQNVRTLIVGDEAVPETLEGARRAGVGRFVHLGASFGADELAAMVDEYVILRSSGRRRILGRAGLDPLRSARLIDAADDLAGEVKLDLDAAEESTWTRLGLDATTN